MKCWQFSIAAQHGNASASTTSSTSRRSRKNRAHYFDRGSDGRLYSVAQFEPWIITYWVDPDGRVVRIIDLELVA